MKYFKQKMGKINGLTEPFEGVGKLNGGNI